MATEAPSWADQWGAGGIGVTPEDENMEKKESQGANPSALGRAKAALSVGAYKIKNGMGKGIKWFKNHFHTKGSTN